MNIIEIIKNNYEPLTNKQKEVANYLIENPADICYISLATLSKKINCSEVTLLNFCKNIGFSNFIELKKEFRNYNQMLVDQFSVSTYHVPAEITDSDSKIDFLENVCSDELNRIVNFYNQVDLKNISNIANIVINKHVIYLFSHDASKVIASFFKSRLNILNLNVVFVDLSDMKQVEYVIKQITVKDVTIFLSFPNYYYSIASIAENIKQKNCEIILLTNSFECPVAAYTKNILICETQTKIFYNSWILPITTLNLLTSALAMIIEDKSKL
ncbi:MAG: MurR/RpiR family transcriptional regulator [Clostridium sp.]|uniref:MurR/RpiR family transcriptional regulator n=1 Tax=Clostridium sp. TaxID=1506 RepID=UPI003025EC5D